MCLQLPIHLSDFFCFSGFFCQRYAQTALNENLVFDKRYAYWPSFIVGLSTKLYGRVISKLLKYWPVSNKLLDYKIWSISLGIRFEIETDVCFLMNSVISVYISTKNK